MKWRCVLSLLLPVVLCACRSPIIHVSIDGDDANKGTINNPLKTLDAAQVMAWKLKRRVSSGPITVLIHPGTHELPRPLELGPEDSGSERSPIIWRAADPADRPVLSAGRQIRGRWQRSDRPGIWSIDLPEARATPGGGGWNFRQLFVDDQRATRARFPNKDEDNPFMFAIGGGIDHAVIDPKLIKDAWLNEKDVQVNIVVNWLFFNQWNTIATIDKKAGKLFFTDEERNGIVNERDYRPNWFWIEGIFAELDRPGEWYLDRQIGRLYYMPKPGADPNKMRFVAPRLDRIIHVKGDLDTGRHVKHLRFEGLEFRHTAFTLGHIAPRVHTDAALHFENTQHSTVTNCHFENTGGYAFWLHLDSQRNAFDRNTAQDLGGGGVLLTGARLSYMDDSKVYTPGEAASKVAPILNEITHNSITGCGRIRYYGGGVHLDSRPASMAMMPGNYIAHNYFADLSRNGIFAFRNQGGNIIEYNHIHDAVKTTIDAACIHFATMNRLNAPNYILNNWLYDIWGYQQMPGGKPIRHKYTNAIFLDWDTSNTTMRDNYAFNSAGEPFKAIWQGWNITNEGNVHTPARSVPPFVDQVGPNGTATHGIDLENNRLIGSVIHYSDRSLVKWQGDWKNKSLRGMGGLFYFNQIQAAPDNPARIVYTMPIERAGTYRVALLYKPDKANATNVKIKVHHADGITEVRWDMSKGHKHGFALEVGRYPFEPGKPAKVLITNDAADGIVVADSIAYVLQVP